MQPDTVHFINAQGVEVQPVRQGDSYTLNVQGSFHEDVQQLTAYYNVKDTAGNPRQMLLGGPNLISYNTIDKHLILVLVNGNSNQTNIDIYQLQTLLNKTYGSANVKCTVSRHAGWDGLPIRNRRGVAFLSVLNFWNDFRCFVLAASRQIGWRAF